MLDQHKENQWEGQKTFLKIPVWITVVQTIVSVLDRTGLLWPQFEVWPLLDMPEHVLGVQHQPGLFCNPRRQPHLLSQCLFTDYWIKCLGPSPQNQLNGQYMNIFYCSTYSFNVNRHSDPVKTFLGLSLCRCGCWCVLNRLHD